MQRISPFPSSGLPISTLEPSESLAPGCTNTVYNFPARAGSDNRWSPSDHSELRPKPIGNSAGDLCRRLVGYREHRTDVDLAKHVAVGPVGAGRAEHEVRVPDHRQVARWDVEQRGQLRRPLVFHNSGQALEARIGVGGVKP